MKKIILFFIFNFFFLQKSFSQVGINTQNPKGVLDINSLMENGNYGGLVLPIVENTDQVFTPDGQLAVEGTLIYDTKNHCIRYKKKASWSDCLGYNSSKSKREVVGIKSKNEEIRLRELENELAQKQEDLKDKLSEIEDLKEESTKKDLKIKEKEELSTKYEKEKSENNSKIKFLEESIAKKDSKNTQLIQRLTQELAQKQEDLKDKLSKIEDLKEESIKKDLKIKEKEELSTKYEKEKSENNSKIKFLEESIAKKDSKNTQLIQGLTQELNQKQEDLKDKLSKIEDLKEESTKKDLKIKQKEELLTKYEKEKSENNSKIKFLEGQLTKEGLKSMQLQSQLSGQEKILGNKTLEIQSIRIELNQAKEEIQQLGAQIETAKSRSIREADLAITQFVSLPLELKEITNKFFSPQGKERDIPYMSLLIDLHRFANLLRSFQIEKNQSLIRAVDKIRADFIGLDSPIREMRNYMRIEGKISRKAQSQSFEVKNAFYEKHQEFLALEENINRLRNQSFSREYKKIKRNFEDLKELSFEFHHKIKVFFEKEKTKNNF